MIFQWLTVPKSNETKQVQAVKTWEVRWKSRFGEYSSDVKPEIEVFVSEELARNFAQALKNAFALTRNTSTSGTKITVAEKK